MAAADKLPGPPYSAALRVEPGSRGNNRGLSRIPSQQLESQQKSLLFKSGIVSVNQFNNSVNFCAIAAPQLCQHRAAVGLVEQAAVGETLESLFQVTGRMKANALPKSVAYSLEFVETDGIVVGKMQNTKGGVVLLDKPIK